MVDRSRLRQFVLDYFSDDELEDLTFDYFPDVQRLFTARMNKSQKARELIDFAGRRGRLDHLLAALEKARPEAYCEFFQKEHEDLPPEPAPVAARDPQKLFISYANPDQEFAYQLAGDLRNEGFDVWIAPDSIQPGEKWVDAINRGLMESGIFLLVLTPDAVSSKWVYDETSVAIALENKNQVRFLTLSVKPADAPPLWAIRQHISFEGNYEKGFKSLLSALRPAKTALLRPIAPRAAEIDTAAMPAETSPTMIAAELPELLIGWPTGERQSYPLKKAITRIGRSPGSDIVLDHDAISNSHLLIQTEGSPGGFVFRVTDLGSTNGAYLNSRKLPVNSARLVQPGDTLHLGDPSGPSLTIIIRDSPAGTAAVGRKTTGASPPPAAGARSAPADPVRSTAPEATAGKRPNWLPVVGVLILIGAAIGGYVLLTNRRQNSNAAANGLATIGVVAPTSAATERAVAAIVPTLTTAPIEERITPSVEATRTALPTPTVTVEATEQSTATAPPPTSAPLPVSVNAIALGPGASLDFESFGLWTIGDQENGTLSQSSVESRSGRSARLDYDFPSATNDFVVFLQDHAITGAPNAVRLWVFGDSSGHFLNAWIVDDEGQTWQAPFGQVLHDGWRQMTALIDTNQDWPWTHISGPDNGEVDYTIRLRGVVLDDSSADFIGQGTIYLDDLTVATVEGVESTASGSTTPLTAEPAADSPTPGAIGSILFTSGDVIYTADPAWGSAQLLGTVDANTCSSEAKTAEGGAFKLNPAPYCNIGGGTAVCPSPNGQYEVLVGTTAAGRSVLVRPAATEGGNFIYDGPLDTSEGILWSPTSETFLFVIGDDVNQGFVEGGSRAIIQSAYSPQFSPDGQSVLFVRAGSSRDVIVWKDGAGEQNVSNLGLGDIFCPRWAAES